MDVYVAKSGSDASGDGSKSSPWASINKAISESKGSTETISVNIAEGVYNEYITVLKGEFVGLELHGGYHNQNGFWQFSPGDATTIIENVIVNDLVRINDTPTTISHLNFRHTGDLYSFVGMFTNFNLADYTTITNCFGDNITFIAGNVLFSNTYNGGITSLHAENNKVVHDRNYFRSLPYGISSNFAINNHVKGSWIETGISANVLINNRIEDCYRALGDQSSIYLEGNVILNCRNVTNSLSPVPFITGKNNIIAGCRTAFAGAGQIDLENSVIAGSSFAVSRPGSLKNCILWGNAGGKSAGNTITYSFTPFSGEGNIWDPDGPGFEGWFPNSLDNPLYVDSDQETSFPLQMPPNFPYTTTQHDGSELNPFSRVSQAFGQYSFRLREDSPVRGMGFGGVDMGAYPMGENGYATSGSEKALILVKPGTYDEIEIIIRLGAIVSGVDRDSTIFQAPVADSTAFFMGQGGELQNVTITRQINGVYAENTWWSVKNCRIYNCQYGIYQRDDSFGLNGKIEILNNVVFDCFSGINVLPPYSNVEVAYNTTFDNQSQGISIRSNDLTQGIEGNIHHNISYNNDGAGIQAGSNISTYNNISYNNEVGVAGWNRVYNNLVYNNSDAGLRSIGECVNNTIWGNGVGIRCSSRFTHQFIHNNIIWNNGESIVGNLDPTDIISFNCIETTPTVTGPIINDNFFADPMLADPGAGMFGLMATSPYIDAGIHNWLPETDLNEAPRIQDGDADLHPRVDIGAYEFPEPPPSGDFILAR